MAMDKNMKLHKAREVIEKHKLFFIEDVCAFIGISKDTFYRWWPGHSPQYKEIAEMLERNKIETKASIRLKLYQSKKAGELLALYKLIATDEERRMLSMNYHDHTSRGEKISTPVDLSKLPDNVLEEILKAKKLD
jgi:ACT domain-containing protein